MPSEQPPEMSDVEPLHGEDLEATAADHREAVDLALRSADADARWHDYEGALRWLDVAEGLDLALPGMYAAKREAWRELAGR
jgi:hypothetical protein